MVVLPDTAKALTFDDRRHIYRLKGIELPSVTQVMKPLSDETYRSVEPRVLNRAADKGTAVHNAIENYISFGIEDIDPEFSGYFIAFLRWYQEFNVKPIASEYRLYHKFMGYAGTADLICDIGGQLHLVGQLLPGPEPLFHRDPAVQRLSRLLGQISHGPRLFPLDNSEAYYITCCQTLQ